MLADNTTLRSALKAKRPLILDGAMGTMIQSYGLTEEQFRGLQHDSSSAYAFSFTNLPKLQKGNNDLLCLTQPDVIADIHRRYLLAGADIITTNTFNAQRISLSDYGCEHLVAEINRAAVSIARQAADAVSSAPHFIVGSVGPTNKSLSMSPDINDPACRALSFDDLVEAYVEQMTALIDAGVDALLIETIFDTLNAKAAIYAADEAARRVGREVPLMLSATVSDRAGRLLSGQTLEAFVVSVSHANLLSIGLNCSFGATDMLPNLRQLSAAAKAYAREPIFISAYPNAGLPNQLGQYDESPELMAQHVRPFLTEHLVDILGGCCGTTDEHIKALKSLVDSLAPSPTLLEEGENQPRSSFNLAGLEPLILPPSLPQEDVFSTGTKEVVGQASFNASSFVNVGERCNVAGSRKFLRLIKEKNYDEAIAIARSQVENGALVLDINLDDGLLDTRAEMIHFLNLLAAEPDICRVPFMIDSSKWEVIRAALGCIQGKSIVNSISLKEGEEIFLQRAQEIHRLGAAVVVMAFDEEGQATTYERRIEVCERAYHLLTERIGFPPEDIIFDPNVLAIATGLPEHDRYALDFIKATNWIRCDLPGAHISGGVSNLSFAFRGNNYLREAMHAVFLYHARQAGLDMAILNPATRVTYDDIPADELDIIEDAILARHDNACDHLIALAERLAAEKEKPSTTTASSTTTEANVDSVSGSSESRLASGLSGSQELPSLDERLITALRKGATDTLEADLTEALKIYSSPIAIIEGPLMAGMNLVGQLFGEGKMFLPQVVKTARTMKRAVEILQPRIEAQKVATASSHAAPSILVATVKGDVHDIGKNIVATVMSCNGYDVIDLGVMVPAETIVEKALELKPDLIGLSGLITPSLEEMVHTVHLLSQAGVHVPIMIGGATTSPLHTALKIAPAYDGPVIHVCDASQNAPLAAPFLDPATAHQAQTALAREQEALRTNATADHTPTIPLEEARARKPKFFS